jgi:hypothetical protein
MSYREENDQVILTMSREDYNALIYKLGVAAGYAMIDSKPQFAEDLKFMNRLNEGNPHYSPYKVEAEKK